MAVTEVQNRPSIMPGPKIEGAGRRPEASFCLDPSSHTQSANFPADKVTIDSKLGIEIRPGPTPGHNIIRITDLKTGQVTEIPPVSEADLTAYVQNLLLS